MKIIRRSIHAPSTDTDKWHRLRITAWVKGATPEEGARAIISPTVLRLYGMEPWEGTLYLDGLTAVLDNPGVYVTHRPPPVWKQKLRQSRWMPRRWRWGKNWVENPSMEVKVDGWSP